MRGDMSDDGKSNLEFVTRAAKKYPEVVGVIVGFTAATFVWLIIGLAIFSSSSVCPAVN